LADFQHQIIAIVSDNASNNDTMMVGLEHRFAAKQIPFLASEARIRCLPHVIDLAATKVCIVLDSCSFVSDYYYVQILTSLGIVAESDITAINVNYQDALNTIQATLETPEAEELEADDLAILRQSLEIVSKRVVPGPLTRAASALSKVMFILLW
jgi:hypothetical protein